MSKRKYNETIVIRDGQLVYAISLANKKASSNQSGGGSYILIRNGQVHFEDVGWIRGATEFDLGNEAHLAAKEIFASQLQVDIKRRILELKQLEAVFREIDLPECFGSVLVDNTALLTEIRDEIGKTKEVTKEAAKEAVQETVRDVALKPGAKKVCGAKAKDEDMEVTKNG